MYPRIGDIVGFFVHDSIVENGQNVEYRVVDLRFGRLMEVDLSGNPADKRIVIQPMPYSGPGVESQPNAPRSSGRVWEIKLGA